MTEAHFDELLVRLGTGKWNYIFFIAMSICGFIMPFHYLEGIFATPIVPHECTEYTSPTENLTSYSLADLQALGMVHNVTNEEAKCSLEVSGDPAEEGSESQTFRCTDWDYHTNNTLTSEFDLVCDRAYLATTYQSFFLIGSLIGCILNGIFADRVGRLAVLWVATIIFVTFTIASTWITSFSAIVNVRLIIGMVEPPIIQTCFNLCMEVCEPRLRSVLGIILANPWAFGTMGLGGLAYLIRDWRWLQLAISLPTLLIIPVLYLCDESPRWLIVRGRHKQARRTLKRAARLNGASLPPDDQLNLIMTQIQKESKLTTATTARGFRQRLRQISDAVLVLFRTSTIRRIMLVLCLDFCVVSFVFLGMSLNGVSYSDNQYLYTALSGLVEVPAYTLVVPIVMRVGRRLPVACLYLLSGAFIMALAFIPPELPWLVMVLAQLGKFSISAAFQILYMYASELIPTDVRLQGFGCAALAAKVGEMGSPFVTQILAPLYPLAPTMLFGLTSVMAGLGTLLLPETLGADLPDTIADLEHGFSGRFIKGKSSREDKQGAGEEGESFTELQRT
ncbi:solute carrier family 22 member 13-like isoform X2 [Panulirus ornatus]|uniref:solute carrier family 22 member 13-like isoform X2 n=1 Tax=Panulirus ornatus TaxID=150431 RepID=UPI003A86FA02